MSDEGKKYFLKLNESKHGKLETQFDFYYLCLIAGLLKKKITACKGEEFVDNFPKSHFPQREQIIGLLISTEISRNGVDKDNRLGLERLMLKLVKPDSITHLSPEGEDLLNQYAETGFRLIIEEMSKPPVNLDTFLLTYYEKIIKKEN